MSFQWHAYPTPELAAEACSNQVSMRLEEALSGRDCATLAVSGGTTPKLLFERLARAPLPWDRIHLFWVDERAVPPTDPASNYRLAEETLIRPARIPRRNVHRIQGEFKPESAARRYADEIRDFFGLAEGEIPHFDVIQRGMGADGHTASLFPNEPLLNDRERLVAAVFVETLQQWRVTLLPAALLGANHSVFLVTGEDKAQAVRMVFKDPYDPMRCPAQMASHHGRGVTWFLDAAAARLMD
jgi:6-phosphogluconolactonase